MYTEKQEEKEMKAKTQQKSKKVSDSQNGCNISKLFRLTQEVAEQLKKKSTAKGMTESAYIRMIIMSSPKEFPEIRQELARLNNEVNHIGVNINQIAKNNNSHLYLESDKLKLLAYMKQLKQLIYETYQRLDKS